MSTQYTVILRDDHDWGTQEYKEKVIKTITSKLKKEQNVRVYLVASYFTFIVLEWERFPVYLQEYRHYVLDYCDKVFYCSDFNANLIELKNGEPTRFELHLDNLIEKIKHTKNTYYPDFLEHIFISDLIKIYNKRIQAKK